MSSFRGFPEGRVRLIPVPNDFFTELLPQIDDINEFKLLLYVLWRLDRMEGAFRYLRKSDFLEDERFMSGLDSAPEAAPAALEQALDKALRRKSLLGAEVDLGQGPEMLYFLNSPKGRAAVGAIQRGEWRPQTAPHLPVELALEPPNIFRLYEENIGPLTPLIADALRDAENTYPLPWIEEAIRIAVENNKRNWRYITAILDRWQQEGRDERTNRRDSEKDRQRYSEWGN